MNYKLMITERAQEHLDQIVYHLLRRGENYYTAPQFLDNLEKILDCLTEKPYKFPECRDKYIDNKSYREAAMPDMNYLVIFKIKEETVYLLGIFRC